MDLPGSSDPTRPIRSDTLYVSYLVRQGLRLAALKTPEQTPNSDSLAESVLTEWLAKAHPEIIEHLKDREERDKSFRDSLKPENHFNNKVQP